MATTCYLIIARRDRMCGEYDQWNIQYQKHGDGPENEPLLERFLQVVDPTTLKIVEISDFHNALRAACSAAYTMFTMFRRGEDSRAFEAIKVFAEQHGFDTNQVAPVWRPPTGAATRAEPCEWWRMMLELPRADEPPTFRDPDGWREWWRNHVAIAYARYGESMPREINCCSRSATETQMIKELVQVGRELHSFLGKPPTFSFSGYLNHVNWVDDDGQLLDHDPHRHARLLAAVSEQLGWRMRQ